MNLIYKAHNVSEKLTESEAESVVLAVIVVGLIFLLIQLFLFSPYSGLVNFSDLH